MNKTIATAVMFITFLAVLQPCRASDTDFRKPTKVLLVGVKDYPNSKAPSLPGTQNDIELFTRLFVDKMGVSETDIVVLSVNSPRLASTLVAGPRGFKVQLLRLVP